MWCPKIITLTLALLNSQTQTSIPYLILVGLSVGEVRGLSCLPSKEPMQVGTYDLLWAQQNNSFKLSSILRSYPVCVCHQLPPCGIGRTPLWRSSSLRRQTSLASSCYSAISYHLRDSYISEWKSAGISFTGLGTGLNMDQNFVALIMVDIWRCSLTFMIFSRFKIFSAFSCILLCCCNQGASTGRR